VTKHKPPGVATERETIGRASADMQGCYALIYQRRGGPRLHVDQLRLPPVAANIKAKVWRTDIFFDLIMQKFEDFKYKYID
jgi:hypothetical protein